MNQRALALLAICLSLLVLGIVLFSDACEDQNCWRLTSALRWIGRALQML